MAAVVFLFGKFKFKRAELVAIGFCLNLFNILNIIIIILKCSPKIDSVFFVET